MELHSLKKVGRIEKKKRVGRGGKRGKTAGRGTKGQKARAGNKRRPQWRDDIKKLPKRRGYGRNRADTVVPQNKARIVTLESLAENFKNCDTVNVAALVKAGLVSKSSGNYPKVKLLGNTEFKTKLTVEGMQASKGAKEAIEKAGGKVS